MTREDILKGEYETIEYKKEIPEDKDKYLKTAVAFANGAGGKLIFGVKNGTWDVIGFFADEIFIKMDAITNSIYDACEPKIVPHMEIQEVDGKQIIVAQIYPGMAKPYYLKSVGMTDGTYIRVSGLTRQAEKFTIQELRLEGTNRSFDQQKADREVSDKEIKELCKRMYEHAKDNCATQEEADSLKRVTESQLVSWKLLIREDGRYYPTNGFKLLQGEDDFIPDAAVQCAVFKGTDRSVFITRKDITGPIDQQVEDAVSFVLQNIRLGSRIEGIQRRDFYELPVKSIREMIANAICHRSYLTPGRVQVAIYDDRLEVSSPGRVSSELTMDMLKEGNSLIRNKVIAPAFQYMKLIERWGTGIPNIFKEARDYGLKEPKIENIGTQFRFTLYRREFDADMSGVIDPSTRGANDINDTNTDANDAKNEANEISGDAKLIKIIDSNPRISAPKLAEMLGVSRSTVQRKQKALQKAGKLTRKGGTRGFWKVHE